MTTEISFSKHSRITEIRQEWEALDRMASENGVKYAAYSFYQTYTWNRFLYEHIRGEDAEKTYDPPCLHTDET